MNNMPFIRNTIKEAMSYATSAHAIILSKTKNESIAAAYIAASLARSSAAEVMYHSIPDWENDDIEKFFSLLHIFSNEALDSLATNHSPQQTDLDFNRLKDCFNNLPL